MEWYLKALRQYADFHGRARRKEYWMFNLFFLLFTLLLGFTSTFIGGDSGLFGIAIIVIWLLIHFIPIVSVTVRRLHDMGQSGWWYLLSFVPLGGIVLFVFTVLDSQPHTNKWGPSPKYQSEDEAFGEDDVLDDFS